MRKTLLLSAALLCAASLNVEAQNYTKIDFGSVTFDDYYGDNVATYGIFNKVSNNGKYAVGYDITTYETLAAFLWMRENPKQIYHLNQTLDRVSMMDVSDDGVIVGSFEQRDYTSAETALKKAVTYPGTCDLDGAWTQLPVPANYSLKNAKSEDFTEQARAITPDGKYIAGNISLKMGEKDLGSDLGTLDVVYDLPVLWTKGAEGYELTKVFYGLGRGSKVYKDGAWTDGKDSVNYNSFMTYDITQDGSTIVGMNVSGCGGFNPAFIRDGKLYQIIDCGEEASYEETDEPDVNFNGGILISADAYNNFYGYYQESDGYTYKYFMFTNDNKLVYLDNPIITADKSGKQYAKSTAGISYVMSVSDDGSVIAGGGVGSDGIEQYNTPAVAYTTGSSDGIALAKAENEAVKLDYRQGGNLYVNGLYRRASIYNAAGKLVAQGGQGHAFNLSAKAGGVYVVKVETAQGVKTFKLAR